MDPNDVLDLMKDRRSIRSFTFEPVAEEKIEKILEAARWTQSASNRQPWKLIVIKNRPLIAELSEIALYGRFIRTAPVVIAIVGLKDEAPQWYLQDNSMLAHQICLMAWSQGLGTCWIGSLDRDKGAEILKLRDKDFLITVLPIGHFRTKPAPPPRKDIDDFVSFID